MSALEAYLAREDWRERAACRRADPEDFFSSDPELALHFCGGCPVRGECARYAEENDVEYGVWGGLTEAERQGRVDGRRRAGTTRPPRTPRHGTVAAGRAHYDRGETPCSKCAVALADYDQELRGMSARRVGR